MQVTTDRYEDRIGGAPIIRDDAFPAGNAFAFTQRFFLFRELNLFGFQNLGIDEQALFAGRHIKLPEVEPVALILAGFQKGHAFAVRAVFHPAWRGARQAGTGEEAFNCKGLLVDHGACFNG